jgi:hypothetical protein
MMLAGFADFGPGNGEAGGGQPGKTAAGHDNDQRAMVLISFAGLGDAEWRRRGAHATTFAA